jgi:hypothetical protein
MAKLTGPLFSLGAHGKLGKDLIYQSGKNSRSVKIYKAPADQKTADQIAVRSIFKTAVDFWNTHLRPLKVVSFNGSTSSIHHFPMSDLVSLSNGYLRMTLIINTPRDGDRYFIQGLGTTNRLFFTKFLTGNLFNFRFADNNFNTTGYQSGVPLTVEMSWDNENSYVFLEGSLKDTSAHVPFTDLGNGSIGSSTSFDGDLLEVAFANETKSTVDQVVSLSSRYLSSNNFGSVCVDLLGTNNVPMNNTSYAYLSNIETPSADYDDHTAWSNAARYFRKHQNGYIAFCKNAFLAAQQLPSASFFVKTLNTAADNIRLEMRELDSREGGTEAGSFRAVVSSLPTGPVNVYTTSGSAEELILDVSDVFDPGDSVWIQLSKELPDGTRIDRSGLINIVLT